MSRSALDAFREAFKASNHPTDGLYLAIVAETLGDRSERDTALREVGSQGNRMARWARCSATPRSRGQGQA
ncbi:MAG: hypothetical protein WKF75_20745 [Singulisphaera sp.]